MTLFEILTLVLLALILLGLLIIWLSRGKTDLSPFERLERELRNDISSTSRGNREEIGAGIGRFQQAFSAQLTAATTTQNDQIDRFSISLVQLKDANEQKLDAFRLALTHNAQANRDEQSQTLQRFSETLQQQLTALSEANERRLTEIRNTLETKLKDMQQDNAIKLEEMRKTVDEKLHATLEQRLGESFKLVSERLEQVHNGLGEMKTLAQGVGDLKRVLTNVKSRGTWGEVQLEMLLEQILTPDQYAKNVKTVPGSDATVEFAIKLPGKGLTDAPVWLPIDAKFPKEQYERLIDALDRAAIEEANTAAKELETALRKEAKTISEKYLAPPHTTDFAILFLPTEGLYAEVLRRPGLTDDLQRNHRVTIAGPTTLTAVLNSLQMGFRTLALEKRSSEVWEVLGAVKTEFGKFGSVFDSVKKTLETAASKIDSAQTRTRVMQSKLRNVEAMPVAEVDKLLGDGGIDTGESAADEG